MVRSISLLEGEKNTGSLSVGLEIFVLEYLLVRKLTSMVGAMVSGVGCISLGVSLEVGAGQFSAATVDRADWESVRFKLSGSIVVDIVTGSDERG